MQFIVLGKELVFSYFCVYCKSAVQTAMLFRVQIVKPGVHAQSGALN